MDSGEKPLWAEFIVVWDEGERGQNGFMEL